MPQWVGELSTLIMSNSFSVIKKKTPRNPNNLGPPKKTDMTSTRQQAETVTSSLYAFLFSSTLNSCILIVLNPATTKQCVTNVMNRPTSTFGILNIKLLILQVFMDFNIVVGRLSKHTWARATRFA